MSKVHVSPHRRQLLLGAAATTAGTAYAGPRGTAPAAAVTKIGFGGPAR